MILTDPADPPIGPVLVQAGALSPSERCERRVLVGLWAGVERQCKTDAACGTIPNARNCGANPEPM